MNKKNNGIKQIFNTALEYHQKKDFVNAEKLYKNILKTNPNHFQTIFLLGSLSIQNNNFDLAINF